MSAEVRELVYAQIGFVNALRCHLRREDPIPALTPFFAPALVEALRGEQNVPAAVLAWTATRLRRVFDGRRADDTFRLVALDAIGRAVESPFEGEANDTPMTALCRTIEINLRQMLGERELPPPVQPVDGILY